MPKKYYNVDIDLNKNELQNPVIHNLPEAPANPKKGQHYFNTVDNTEYIWNGTEWVNALSQGSYTFSDGITEKDRNVTLDKASKFAIGGVIIGNNINVKYGKISVDSASEAKQGIIQVASDDEVTAGEETLKAVNPKQLKSGLDEKVNKNNPIESGTHTKITYDEKGLVTAGEDITLSDVTDITVTADEVNQLEGVKSNVQEQIDEITSDFEDAIAEEREARINADNALTLALETETGLRTEADNQLRADLTAETEARTEADTNLETEVEEVSSDLTAHKNNKDNPHEVTKAQVGLGNVDNTSDLDKPISTATQEELDRIDATLEEKADKTEIHDGTLTIQKNGVDIGTFSANQSADKTINIEADKILVDEQTIQFNSDQELESIGTIMKSGGVKYDWEGTEAEYNEAWSKGLIDPSWYCHILDDGEKSQAVIANMQHIDEVAENIDLIREAVPSAEAAKYYAELAEYYAEQSKDPMEWGAIHGDLGNQNDLMNKFDTKGDGLYFDPEEKLLYLTSNGEIISEGIPVSGGGGGDLPVYDLTTQMPSTLTIAEGDSLEVICNYQTTGTPRATAHYIINGETKGNLTLRANGNFSFDVGEFVGVGQSSLEVKVVDVFGQTQSLFFTINVISLTISSTFDSSVVYNSDVTFRYTPVGEITKTIHFLLDDVETTETVTTSGRQQTKVFQMEHGVHTLEVWATASLGDTQITSNRLIYEIMYVDGEGTLIASEFRRTNFMQGELVSIPFIVYNTNSLTSILDVYVDDVLVSEMEVDRTRQTWSKTISTVGDVEIKFVSGDAERTFNINVEEVHIDVEPVTENLELFLTATGRSNSDINREHWDYGNVHCTLSGFNFVNNGWINNALKISSGARVTIPFKIFEKDFRANGKTIEIEFSTSNVLDYDSVVLNCMNDRGIQITAQNAILKSEQSQVGVKFKEDETVRLSFVVENRASYRLIYTYINGIISGLTQYPDDDDFHQVDPLNIVLGSDTCDIDVYNIRIYDSYLTHYDVLNNFIADTADISKKLNLYTRNNVYDSYGNIMYNKLIAQIPIMTITGDLPSSKGDKKKVLVRYENQQDPDRSFEMNDVTIDIQGTSSQYYPKKNYKISKMPLTYKLRAKSLGEKVFTLKADYMESSHAHNTGIARFSNDTYSTKTPPQENNENVRTAIDGFPIAMFYKPTPSSTPQYFGVFNFNNDKESNNVWGFSAGCESWEVCNNTSDRCLFKSDDFTDPEAVLTDFEARYPADYTDTTYLHELVSWVVSCDSEKATGTELPYPVTIGEVTYTTDSAEYRIAKFKNECEDYFNLDFLLTYYVISEFLGMVDSRAKNMFLNLYNDGKWYPVFYDCDTAIGLNNEGVNDFSFDIEYHDTIGTEHVFNGERSALWNMVERAYSTEITDLYNSYRNNKLLSYDRLMEYLYESQIAKICEAQYNSDAQVKYVSPLTEEGIATYLYTAQGSRIDHIKWWLYNRFHYLDSKYVASEYKDNYMTLRLYTPSVWQEVEPDATITLTPYIDQYLRIKYGSYDVYQKAKHGEETEMVPPTIRFNDTETIIYGADKIISIGDLAPLYAGTIDVSKATKLSELKIGHGGEYSNTNLKSLALGNNLMLKSLDIRNCPMLSGALDVSGCSNILDIRATGTSLTSIKLADAGSITRLELPDTITNLTIKNQNSIETFECGRNMTTLVIENSNLDTKELFEECEALTKVRLIGIDWNIEDFSILDRAYNMLGQDEGGYNLPHGVLSGVVRIPSAKESDVEAYKAKFIGLDIIVDAYIEEDYICTDFGEIITTNTGARLLYT